MGLPVRVYMIQKVALGRGETLVVRVKGNTNFVVCDNIRVRHMRWGSRYVAGVTCCWTWL